jgi:hypothetical protein
MSFQKDYFAFIIKTQRQQLTLIPNPEKLIVFLNPIKTAFFAGEEAQSNS